MGTVRGRRWYRLLTVVLGVGLTASAQALLPPSAPAASGWAVEGTAATVTLSTATTRTVSLDCSPGYVPLSGGVYRANGDPTALPLVSESVATTDAVSSPSDYRAVVRLGGETSVEVTARLLCVKTDEPLAITAVSDQPLSNLATGTQLATANTVTCPAGSFAINASFDPTATADQVADAWILHSSPSADGQAWHAMAATVSHTFIVDVPIVVHCLAGSEVPGATVEPTATTISATNSFVGQACPSGTAALTGGSYGSQVATDPDRSVETPRISQWHDTFGLSAHQASANRVSETHTRVISVALCWHVPTPAVLDVSKKPPTVSSSSNATFDFTATGSPTVYCHLDGASEQECTSPAAYQGLAEGPHTWHWRTVNTYGDEASGSYPWTIDTVAPTAVMTSPGNGFTLTRGATVGWQGADATSGIASYALYTRLAPYDSGFLTVPGSQPFPGTQTTTNVTGLSRGVTYCYSAEAIDQAGWRSTRSAERCITAPVDDRQLSASGGWTRRTGTGLYAGTETLSKAQGSTLKLPKARVSRIAVVATRCPGCGRIGVYVGTTLLGKLSLDADTVQKKRVLLLPRVALRTATITIKVLSSAKPVHIDGLGVSPR